jgi:hypothetical protein
MRSGLARAAALGLALAPFAVAPALADEPAAAFRSVERQTFTSEDLQRYGLSAEQADQVLSYQDQGYEVRIMTREEAKQLKAGFTDTEWLLIGVLVGVVVIALV